MATPLITPVSSTGSLAEIGTTGLRRWGGQIQEEFLQELRGVRGVRVFEEMRKNDPTIGGVLRATTDTIRAVSWAAEPASDSAPDREAAEFLDQNLVDMSMSWEDVISESLTMLAFGWAYMEIVYKQRLGKDNKPPSDYDDRRIGWRKIALRGQETLREWEFADDGGIVAMHQLDPIRMEIGAKRIPIEKAILFRTTREKNNPEGVSLIRPAYRPWYFKKQLEEVEAIGIERDLTGLPIIKLPHGANDGDQAAARDILEKLKTDETSGLILPKGADPTGRLDWEFELMGSPGSKSIDVDKAISRFTGEIAVAFLAQFLRLGMTRVGSYALSRDHKDLFFNSITSILDNIEATINRFLVPKLFAFNSFPGMTVPPALKHGKVGQRDINTFANAMRVMSDIGLLGPKTAALVKFIRGELDMPLPTSGDLAEWEEAKEALANLPTAQPELPGSNGRQTDEPGTPEGTPEPASPITKDRK